MGNNELISCRTAESKTLAVEINMVFKISHEDCVRMVRGMKRMPDSPAHFSVYCCEDSNVCVKMNNNSFILYYNVREEYVGREDLLPIAFKNKLEFGIIK